MSIQNGKIVGYLGDNKFIIQLPPEEEHNGNPSIEIVTVAHDYVRFHGRSNFEMVRNEKGEYPYESKSGACNWVNSEASVTISVRAMIEVVLPLLNSHEYLQPERLKDREHAEDDKYYALHNRTKPRWLKGDKYPAYAFDSDIIQFYCRKKNMNMVSFRRCGEAHWETVSLSLFNQIKNSLKLIWRKDEL